MENCGIKNCISGAKREAGILLPVSALPGKFGIGSLGKEAFAFADFLAASGQKYWQVLPVGPTSAGDSPYQSFSVFAGNPYFVDLDILCSEGLLTEEETAAAELESGGAVDYDKVYSSRFAVLRRAFERFGKSEEYCAFEESNSFWIEDYALYMAEKNESGQAPWYDWSEAISLHRNSAVESEKVRLQKELDFWKFVQFEFDKQWSALRKYANEKGVKLIGDMPIYVAPDSADAWANYALFLTDENHRPTAVAGVPPDYFCATGQLWGNCLYDWNKMESDNFLWWRQRMSCMAKKFDVVRIDHFIGFSRYWEVPFGNKTAENGKYVDGPKMKIVNALDEVRGETKIIAENLGLIVPSVRELIEQSGYPGMAVLQFGFGGGDDNDNLPKNIRANTVAYTGTHDNDTTRGWLEKAQDFEIDKIRELAKIEKEEKPTVDDFIALALSCAANTVIVPIQDYLELGSEARINVPGTPNGNWRWRMDGSALDERLAEKIKKLCREGGR